MLPQGKKLFLVTAFDFFYKIWSNYYRKLRKGYKNMEITIKVKVNTPTGRTDEDIATFNADKDFVLAAQEMADSIGEELISDMFDLDYIIGKNSTEENYIRNIEEKYWENYLANSKVTWDLISTSGNFKREK